MAVKSKKAKKARKNASPGLRLALEQNTAALREHTQELRRHSQILQAAISAGLPSPAPPLDSTLFHETALLVGKPSLTEIKRRFAEATGNDVAGLNDSNKVIQMMAGGPAVRDNLMSKINNEFWPGVDIPHLRFDDVKGMTIGELVSRIRQLL